MKLRGITVSVGYADLLARSIDRWSNGLDRLIVVTSTSDYATRALCDFHNVEVFTTDIFTANGAKFNKGAALSHAALETNLRQDGDWMLAFDADIIPPTDWRNQLANASPTCGKLYGSVRYWVPEKDPNPRPHPTRRMPQGWPIGFFLAFGCDDPHLPPTGPLWRSYSSAGCYDTDFARCWPKSNHVILELPLVHLGEERQNWCGRGNKKAMEELLAERKRRSGNWAHEQIPLDVPRFRL